MWHVTIEGSRRANADKVGQRSPQTTPDLLWEQPPSTSRIRRKQRHLKMMTCLVAACSIDAEWSACHHARPRFPSSRTLDRKEASPAAALKGRSEHEVGLQVNPSKGTASWGSSKSCHQATGVLEGVVEGVDGEVGGRGIAVERESQSHRQKVGRARFHRLGSARLQGACTFWAA